MLHIAPRDRCVYLVWSRENDASHDTELGALCWCADMHRPVPPKLSSFTVPLLHSRRGEANWPSRRSPVSFSTANVIIYCQGDSKREPLRNSLLLRGTDEFLHVLFILIGSDCGYTIQASSFSQICILKSPRRPQMACNISYGTLITK